MQFIKALNKTFEFGNISLFIPDSQFNEFNGNNKGVTITNKEYSKEIKTLRLIRPLKDSAKYLNKLKVKRINKTFSLFNQIKSLFYKNRNKSYSMLFNNNEFILRFFNLNEDLIKEYKIKIVV